jgi:hypothetical protein
MHRVEETLANDRFDTIGGALTTQGTAPAGLANIKDASVAIDQIGDAV